MTRPSFSCALNWHNCVADTIKHSTILTTTYFDVSIQSALPSPCSTHKTTTRTALLALSTSHQPQHITLSLTSTLAFSAFDPSLGPRYDTIRYDSHTLICDSLAQYGECNFKTFMSWLPIGHTDLLFTALYLVVRYSLFPKPWHRSSLWELRLSARRY